MPPSSIRPPAIWPQCQFSIPKRPVCRFAATPNPENRRHQSSYRRQVKRMSQPPAPFSVPSNFAPQSSHVIFNPPPSAPNVYHTPMKFLPPSDRRRQFYESSHSTYTPRSSKTAPSLVSKPGTPLHEASSTQPASMTPQLPNDTKALPPMLGSRHVKKYHLTADDVAEIQRLRAEDPTTWTRLALAKKFNCSQFFVSIIAKNPEAGRRHREQLDEVKSQWGERKTESREDRRKRVILWGRDA